MNYPEELARVKANLERLETFANRFRWLTEALDYCGLYPEEQVPRFVLVPRNGNRLPTQVRTRLNEVSKHWKRLPSHQGTSWHYETSVDGIHLELLNAEPREQAVIFEPAEERVIS